MTKRWVRAALCGIVLGLPAVAHAQFPFGPGGEAGCVQEPLPLSTPVVATPPPGEMPGLTTKSYTIGGDRSSAFGPEEAFDHGPLENFGEGPGFYFGIGTRGLMRGGFGHRPLAFLDPQNLDSGLIPSNVLVTAPLLLDQKSLGATLAFGPQITIGCRTCDYLAFEVTGFYLPETTKGHGYAKAGRLDLPFFNPPLGFEGDNGLWLQADRVILMNQSTMGSAEANLRCQPIPGYGLEWLFGVRCVDLRERFGILTDDDGLTVVPVDPTRIATYSIMAHNRIAGPQLGVDWEVPMASWLAVGMYAKGTAGANFIDVDVSLTRQDGFAGPGGHRSTIRVSEVAEVAMYIDWVPADRIRFRAGYTAMWLLNVAVASDQVDFDLSHTVGHQSNNGSIFYHGPTLEVHFSF
jgi:hypothetical protein